MPGPRRNSRRIGTTKEIDRRNPLCMIAKEGLPRLQWPIAPRHHVDRDRGLGDLDAEFEQLAMDLGERPTTASQNSFFGSDRARLCRSAVGRSTNATSIASKRQNPFGANARRSLA